MKDRWHSLYGILTILCSLSQVNLQIKGISADNDERKILLIIYYHKGKNNISVSIMSVNQGYWTMNAERVCIHKLIFTIGRTILASHPLASPTKRPIF